MSLIVKICGLSTPETVDAAVDSGADLIGFVFHPKSPRNVTPERAAALAERARGRAKIVALVVDASDDRLETIDRVLRPDFWQAHGAEDVDRLRRIRATFGKPVIKAVGFSAPSDQDEATRFAHHADMLLLDAKPPKDAAYPGGHGRPFDWRLLDNMGADFILSGGLSPENVGDAIRTMRTMGLNLAGVDVSSGVESAPGAKDIAKIRAFVAAARAAG